MDSKPRKGGRPTATEVHRYGLAKATIPVEMPRQHGFLRMSSEDIKSARRVTEEHFARTEPTLSQMYLTTQGTPICLCRSLAHCSKQGSFHPNCVMCGKKPDTYEMLRYYPCDEGWYSLRRQVQRCRELAGFPDLEQETSPPHP